MYSIFAILFLAVAAAQECSVPASPKCPSIKPMKNVDWKQYSGKWIEYQHAANADYTCGKFDYKYNNDVTNPKYTIATKAMTLDGTTALPPSDTPTKLLSCSGTPKANYMDLAAGVPGLPDNTIIYVLLTDYETFTVEYGCQLKADGKPFVTLCVQGREGKPAPNAEMVKTILIANGIDPTIQIDSRPASCTN